MDAFEARRRCFGAEMRPNVSLRRLRSAEVFDVESRNALLSLPESDAVTSVRA